VLADSANYSVPVIIIALRNHQINDASVAYTVLSYVHILSMQGDGTLIISYQTSKVVGFLQ